MIRISPDVGKNRLILELGGRVSSEEMTESLPSFRAAVARLHKPFDILSDVRTLEAIGDISPVLEELPKIAQLKDVRRIARVVGKAADGAVHVERVARSLGLSAHLAFSFEEADSLLTR